MVKNKRTYLLFFSLLLLILDINSLEEKEIKTKEIELKIEFNGVTHPYDEYDIRAEFDGSIVFIYPTTLEIVKKSDPMMRMVTGEVAALLATAKTEDEKKEILQKWKNMFKYSDIKAPTDGIVTKIHVSNNSYVKKGDKLITIAKKMRVIAKNTKPLYMSPISGIDGIIEVDGIKKYNVKLTDFFKEGENSWRFFLEFETIPSIKVGSKVNGFLILANKTTTRVIPNSDILNYMGKKYLLVEFEPGIITETDTEIISFKYNYLKITSDVVKYVK